MEAPGGWFRGVSHLSRDERAQGLVELALAFPLFLYILCGILEVAHLGIARFLVMRAAHAAARAGIVFERNPQKMELAAAMALAPLHGVSSETLKSASLPHLQVAPMIPDPDPFPGELLRLQVTWFEAIRFPFLLKPFLFLKTGLEGPWGAVKDSKVGYRVPLHAEWTMRMQPGSPGSGTTGGPADGGGGASRSW